MGDSMTANGDTGDPFVDVGWALLGVLTLGMAERWRWEAQQEPEPE